MWNEEFWLPKNVSWNDFSRLEQEGLTLPRLSDLLYVYPLAGVLYIIRLIFERLVLKKRRKITTTTKMFFSLFFRNVAQPIGRFCGICDRRQSRSQIGPLGKFSESFWRFSFYLSIFIYGLIILRNVKRRERKKTHRNFFSLRSI